MANFPNENRVILTYNMKEVNVMAEFCVECWNKLNDEKKPRAAYVLSLELELCEECGEWKRTIIAERTSYRIVSHLCSRLRKKKT